MKENLFETILNCVSSSLFTNKPSAIDILDIPSILTEAKLQTVFPLVYSVLCKDYDLSAYQSDYYGYITNNIKITEEHKKLHKLFSENAIPYVFLKGCASAKYYPDPLLRTMGDVDMLINPEDTEEANKVLLAAGYEKYADTNDLSSHIGYRNKNGIVCELHRQINGIPETDVGNKISSLFSDIFEKSVLENGEYYRPSDFHHGLILLLHTATHLTHEGIGLRHLCDWAVFVANFNDKEFINLFERPLKNIGLWKFAQILTQFAIQYLGCPKKTWAGIPDSVLLEEILNDIINGGNFGKKDYSRYQQIKYITPRGHKTVDKTSPFKIGFSNIILKAKSEFSFVKRYPLLLPIGCILTIFKYLFMVISGKRKLDNKKVLIDAAKRKKIYSQLKLYESE